MKVEKKKDYIWFNLDSETEEKIVEKIDTMFNKMA